MKHSFIPRGTSTPFGSEARPRLLAASRRWWQKGRLQDLQGPRQCGGKGARREQLLARIAKSHCRHCGEKGHWRAECPSRNREMPSQSAAATANVVQQDDETILHSINENDEMITNEVLDMAEACERQPTHLNHSAGFFRSHEKICSVDDQNFAHDVEHVFTARTQDMTGKYIPSFNHAANRRKLAQWVSLECLGTKPVAAKIPQSVIDSPTPDKNHVPVQNHAHVNVSHPVPARHALGKMTPAESLRASPVPEAFVVSCPDRCEATCAILDTGASRSVIGSKILATLLQKLPQEVQNAVRKKHSSIKFRFGNNQTLTSK